MKDLNLSDLKECNGGHVPGSYYMTESQHKSWDEGVDAYLSFMNGLWHGIKSAF
jgi:hypothetical protein